MQIPLIDGKKFSLLPLSYSEKAKSAVDIEMFAVKLTSKEGGFSYLTQTDLDKCMKLSHNSLLCQKREITLRSQDVLAYELQPDLLLMELKGADNVVELHCDGMAIKHLKVISRQLVPIAKKCSVSHAMLYVSSAFEEPGLNVSTSNFNVSLDFVEKRAEIKNNSPDLLRLQDSLSETDKKLNELSVDLIAMNTWRENMQMYEHYAPIAGGVSGAWFIMITCCLVVIFIMIKRMR